MIQQFSLDHVTCLSEEAAITARCPFPTEPSSTQNTVSGRGSDYIERILQRKPESWGQTLERAQ